jgi:hypothetical protein
MRDFDKSQRINREIARCLAASSMSPAFNSESLDIEIAGSSSDPN